MILTSGSLEPKTKFKNLKLYWMHFCYYFSKYIIKTINNLMERYKCQIVWSKYLERYKVISTLQLIYCSTSM